MDVRARVLTNDRVLNLRLTRAGLGLALAHERDMHEDVARGALVPVLEAYWSTLPGYHLYYPQRRHASPALRALVDFLRRARRLERG